MTPPLIHFLDDAAVRRTLVLPGKAPADWVPIGSFDGRGDYALEVSAVAAERRPTANAMRECWRELHGGKAMPLLLVVAHPDASGVWSCCVCGPAGDAPAVIHGIDVDHAEGLCRAALSEPSRHMAVRLLTSMLPEVGAELPGLRNQGMFAMHALRYAVPERPDWQVNVERSAALRHLMGRELVEGLGFSVEPGTTATSVLVAGESKRAVAVFLDEGEGFDAPGKRFSDASPVAQALAVADREALPWVLITRGGQIRAYSARPDVGVGRKGRSETFIEADVRLLPADQAGYLTLIFSADALAAGGAFGEILEDSRDYASDLGGRLRERVYRDAVPQLATHLARTQPELDLDDVYEQALVILFRLLFVAYAEDKDLLPYRTNDHYRERSLKKIARSLADRVAEGDTVFDANATDLWDDVRHLWEAVDKGNREWGVPAYNGGMFSSAPEINPAGAALATARISNEAFGPALTALLVDVDASGVPGPVDFRSLSVREFGTIYEGLLESSLSWAEFDLTVGRRGALVPARPGDAVEVVAGEVYFHDRSGARKSSGSYFTKAFAVEHLLDHALEPALDAHVSRIEGLLDADEEARAAAAFFDFRCVDLAMGSGHFLVAAIDHIEARLSALLAERPIPSVTAELERLRAAAYEALGDLGPGIDIEQASLLRRQVARRCVYGVDKNPVAVELARLSIWIHTFVPGLPLSFLDHSLIAGDSLTGVATIQEAGDALATGGSLFVDLISDSLGSAADALARLGRLSDATRSDIADARAAHHAARSAIQPACDLFDLVLLGRIDSAKMPTRFDSESVASNPCLPEARGLSEQLGALHLPIAFPEVFLREAGGFDCILGNPPWDKLQIERHGFYAMHFPGLRGLPQDEAEVELARIEAARPDLRDAYSEETNKVRTAAELLSRGPYPGFTAGRPDLYKAFAWRFLHAVRDGGFVGVVLPRKALEASGMKQWRQEVLESCSIPDLTVLVNNGGWVFDDVHQQYTVALLSLRRGVGDRTVALRGPFRNISEYRRGLADAPVVIGSESILERSAGGTIPLLPSPRMAAVVSKMWAQPGLASPDASWAPKGLREFNATDDKDLFELAPRSDLWPVIKGESFDLWQPDTGTYYAWAEPGVVTEALIARRRNQIRRRRSAFFGRPLAWAEDPSTLPAMSPRIAWRDSTNRTNQRTVIAALIPGDRVLVHQAYYLFWRVGDERDEAFALGIISSIPFDWFARQMVESHVTVEFMDTSPVPRPKRDDPRRRRVELLAGRLAASDARFADWASAVGVEVGELATEEQRAAACAELDALVAHLYGLDEVDIVTIFETFHAGWQYQERLDAVLQQFRAL